MPYPPPPGVSIVITSPAFSCTRHFAGNGSPLTVVGLNNGVIYGCNVSARNAIGDGAPSSLLLVIPAAVLSANLSISMSNGTNFVTGGAPVTYLISVSNAGPAGVVDARVQDVLDQWQGRADDSVKGLYPD